MIQNKVLKEVLTIGTINLYFILICILASFLGDFKYIIYFLIGSIYLLFLLQKCEIKIFKYQLVLLLLNEVILDNLFHYLRIKTTPLELKYMVEMISILLVLKIIRNRKHYKLIFKDSILIILLVSIFINLFVSFLNHSNWIDVFNGLRIYLRFIPLYIVIANNNICMAKIYNYIYYLNLAFLLLQIIIGVHQDLRTGIFGITGSPSFAIFISYKLVEYTMAFSQRSVSLFKFTVISLFTICIFAIVENKTFLILIVGLIFLVIYLSKGKIRKKISVAIVMTVFLVLGVNLIVKMYPNFAYFLSIENMQDNIYNYIFGNSNPVNFDMGRIEGGQYIADIELDSFGRQMLGLGVGTSLPQENWFYMNDGKEINVIDFPESKIYSTYNRRIGYFLSSYNSIYLEFGVVGVGVVLVFLIIILYRGIYLLRKGTVVSVKSIGAMGIVISISALMICGYGGGLLNRNYNYIICIFLGLLSYNYQNINKKREEL